MNLFNRLPGFPRTPAGKERIVLRLLPRAFLLGTLLLLILHWTVLFTVGIAAFIVMMMEGPAYVADAYPLDEVETLDTLLKWKAHGKPHGR